MDQNWWRFNERKIRKYEKLGNFTIEPWGEKYYALYDGNDLVCVTVYKRGAVEVMKRLWGKQRWLNGMMSASIKYEAEIDPEGGEKDHF